MEGIIGNRGINMKRKIGGGGIPGGNDQFHSKRQEEGEVTKLG